MNHFYHTHTCLKAMMIIIMAALGWNVAQARHLTPEEALQLVNNSASAKVPGAPQQYQLAYDGADVYVFTLDSDAQGFLVLGADDQLENVVLGYSDTATFDAANIPPSMQWLLDAYAHQIKLLDTVQDALIYKAANRVNRSAIAPLCATKWNQLAPYNNDCPVIDGTRCVTGCVATAMAQVMKAHEWPITGTGSLTYDYPYPSYTYSESFDFGATTFDWDNMLNEYPYPDGGTEEENAAVAELMHACGAAAQMSYSATESGASDVNAGAGMIAYLGYDKGMQYMQRDWIDSQDDWEDLIYAQLAAAQPVMYSGCDENGTGHSFVCDGYDGSSYFHINWGWGGYADGYFDLTVLNPEFKGAGAGSGSEGYNYLQSALLNIKPAESNSAVPYVMAISSDLATESSTYTRSSKSYITMTSPIWSYTLVNCKMTVGLVYTDGSADNFVPSYTADFNPATGFSVWGNIKTSNFPVGEWDVYPAFKDPDGTVHRAYYDLNSVIGHLRFTVTNDQITISQPGKNGTVDAKFLSYQALNEDDDAIYAGHSYDFNWDVAYSGEWTGKVCCGLVSEGSIVAISTDQVFDFNGNGSEEKTFRMTLSSSLAAQEYTLTLLESMGGNSYYYLGTSTQIEVQKRETSGAASVSDVVFVNATGGGKSSSDPALLSITDGEIQVEYKCTTAPYADEVYLAFGEPDSNYVTIFTNPTWVSIEEKGDKQTVSFKNLSNYLSVDHTYRMFTWSGQGQMKPYTAYYLELSTANSLSSALVDGRKARIEGSCIVLSGFEDSEEVAVYRLNGSLAYRGTARNIPVSGSSLYIVTYPGGSIKLAAPRH